MRVKTIIAFVAGLVLAQVATAAALPDADLVIATQGGQNVTYGDIDQAVAGVPEKDRPAFINNPRRIRSLLVNLLLQKQLAAAAVEAGLDNTPEISAATGAARTELLAKAQMEHRRATLEIPDLAALAQEEYIAHREKYLTSADFEVQQVYVSTSSRSPAEAKALAAEVASEAKSGKVDFDALVAKYSDDPAKAKTLGIIKNAGVRATQKELAAAVDALIVPGTLTEPIETGNGYYVLKLLSRTPARQLTFAEVREQIIASLRDSYISKSTGDYIDELRNKPLDVDSDRVAALRVRYGSMPAMAPPAHARTSVPTPPAEQP